jgi:hypothetical protein
MEKLPSDDSKAGNRDTPRLSETEGKKKVVNQGPQTTISRDPCSYLGDSVDKIHLLIEK